MDAPSLITGFAAGTLLGSFFGAAWITFRISTGQDPRFGPRAPNPYSTEELHTPAPPLPAPRGRFLRL